MLLSIGCQSLTFNTTLIPIGLSQFFTIFPGAGNDASSRSHWF